jgi:hypothetical protein
MYVYYNSQRPSRITGRVRLRAMWLLWQQEFTRGFGGVFGGGLAESEFGENLESYRQLFCVGASRRNLASVAVKMFSRLIYFIQKFCKCTFNAICKAAI